MTNLGDVQKLVEDLGPGNAAVESVVQLAENEWAVIYDAETAVLLEFDGEQGKLILSIAIGEPAEAKKASIHEALLGYNALWHDTGGVRMALAGGQAVQLFDLNMQGVTLSRLGGVLGNFADKARVWRRFVASGAAPLAGMGTQPAGMRV